MVTASWAVSAVPMMVMFDELDNIDWRAVRESGTSMTINNLMAVWLMEEPHNNRGDKC
jgi:hypothetical protein